MGGTRRSWDNVSTLTNFFLKASLNTLQYALRLIYYALCTMHYVICIIHSAVVCFFTNIETRC